MIYIFGNKSFLKVIVKVLLLSCVWLFETPWTVSRQAPLFIGFSRQEYWSGLPCPSPGDHPDPGIEPGSAALQADPLTSEPPEKPNFWRHFQIYKYKEQHNNLHVFIPGFYRYQHSPNLFSSSSNPAFFLNYVFFFFKHSLQYCFTTSKKWISCCCSVAESRLTLCYPMDRSKPGFPVLHHLPELAQTHVHGDVIQQSCPLLSPSPPAFNLSQHQGLF